MTARDQHYTFEEIKAVVDECKMRHIPVWSHCFGDAYNSIKAGVDLLIHGFEIDEKTADMMVEQGTAFCPTINFMPEWLKTFPPVYVPEIHDKYQGDTVAEKEMNRIYENLRRAYEKGVTLTIGSDCFNNEITPYGYTTVGELHMFVEKVGISPMDTIKAATLNGAKVLRVDDITGSVEAGKSADIIVVKGNPLENIRAIDVDGMTVIMKEGEYVRS